VGTITGSSTSEIDAPIDQVWALVEDVEKAPEWQGGLKTLRALDVVPDHVVPPVS
jgi:uncharacterized membrane protein